ncbi:hypothetical protein ACG3SK_14310 [Pseudomonas aeruginosa]
MKIIPMLLAALLATGAATAQAQDGSERSWQYNAEFRAAQKELREKRLQKQQLEAQAQEPTAANAPSARTATAEQPFTEQYTCPFWVAPLDKS